MVCDASIFSSCFVLQIRPTNKVELHNLVVTRTSLFSKTFTLKMHEITHATGDAILHD